MLHLAGPKWEPTAAYYDCRYAILRQPLGFERGAEVLDDDAEAIHAYIEIDQDIVAVGRSHLIPCQQQRLAIRLSRTIRPQDTAFFCT